MRLDTGEPSLDNFFHNDSNGVVYQQNENMTEEALLFQQLCGQYQACPTDSTGVVQESIWKQANKIVDKLVNELNHPEYADLKIIPDEGYSNHFFILNNNFRMQLMPIIQRMAKEFGYGDPMAIMYGNAPTNAPSITNNASATANPSQQVHQENQQRQSQEQEVNLTLEQRFELIQEELNRSLTEEQLKEIQPLFDEYKAQPSKWSVAVKFLKAVLGLSKDVAIGVLSNVVYAQMTKPAL